MKWDFQSQYIMIHVIWTTYHVVGDDIFPLKSWMMKPYPENLSYEQRIYNYRISRARRTIESFKPYVEFINSKLKLVVGVMMHFKH